MMIELDGNGVPVAREKLKGRTFVHFKGNRYKLVDFALDSETMELMVVYRALYGERGFWVRPAKMFFENVARDDYTGPRFRLLEAE